ncbi:hypothetical protein FGRMN_6080 [Fusarium graminum]|nr:hypothetical protein FGRMN_6080 [Fusarium graminum]
MASHASELSLLLLFFMEVLGAVASSIAVIQALAAGKHVISLIREMPDIQKDFEHLMEELRLIRSMAQVVASIPSTAFQQDLIKNASSNLEEITNELDALLRKCAHETDQGDKTIWKTKKRKWLLEKSDIKKLQQRMSQAKETLHFAVTSSQASANSQYAQPPKIQKRAKRQVSSPTGRLRQHREEKLWRQSNKWRKYRRANASVTSLRFGTEALGGCNQCLDPGLHYSSVEVLLETWKNLLAEVGLPIRTGFIARGILRNAELDDHQTYLIRRILSFARDQHDRGTTKVHDAIRQGLGLQEALKEQPWALDAIDDSGYSPLHLATLKLQVLDMELLLSAGANVDQQKYDGISPLMIAAHDGSLEAVTTLLKSKGSVSLTSDK